MNLDIPYDRHNPHILEPFFDIDHVAQLIEWQKTRFAKLYQAVLFPMHGPQIPVLVGVPVDFRAGRADGIDDLDMAYWIKPSKAGGNVVDLDATREFFNRLPDSNRHMNFSCTIYFEDQSNRQGVNRTLKSMGISQSWKGNIVVMKNANFERYIDMTTEDVESVVELLKEFIIVGKLPKKREYSPKA